MKVFLSRFVFVAVALALAVGVAAPAQAFYLQIPRMLITQEGRPGMGAFMPAPGTGGSFSPPSFSGGSSGGPSGGSFSPPSSSGGSGSPGGGGSSFSGPPNSGGQFGSPPGGQFGPPPGGNFNSSPGGNSFNQGQNGPQGGPSSGSFGPGGFPNSQGQSTGPSQGSDMKPFSGSPQSGQGGQFGPPSQGSGTGQGQPFGPGGTQGQGGEQKMGVPSQGMGQGQSTGPGKEQMERMQAEQKSRMEGEQKQMQERNEQQQKQQQEQQMQNMKQGALMMGNNLSKFESMIKESEQKGITIPQETKDKLEKAKSMLEQMKSSQTVEDMQKINTKDIGDLMGSLEQKRQEVSNNTQRLQDIRRGTQGMEQGVKQFESQIAKLQKQNITIPAGITDALSKMKTIIEAVKNAKSFDDAQKAGVDDLPDLMGTLQESRQQLEYLARWPQTLKQVDRQLSQMQQTLKRAKGMVDRLAKKEINVSGPYSEFESGVAKLKSVRDDAVAKVAAGNAQDAFDALQDDFFDQVQDVSEHMRVIETMSNLGRFASDFKRGIADAQRRISDLKRRKIATKELEDLLNKAKAKGAEAQQLMKAQPLDEDAVLSVLQDLENVRQEFDSKVSDLSGEIQQQPWEQGQDQFNTLQLPSGFEKLLQKNTTSSTQTPSAQPSTAPTR